MAKAKALFVDLDGTVRSTKTGRPHPVKLWDQRIRSGVKEKLAEYRDQGYKIVAVTNQGGVAYGLLTEEDVIAINGYLNEKLLPDTFDLILYCPYHAKGRVEKYKKDAECRKPKPGMAFDARDQLDLDLRESIMVGDMETDKEFATNAGIGTYYEASEFFGPDQEPARRAAKKTTKRATKKA
ncbi:MAG TPA: HAD-IIIA family hydrolase [Chloroflexota bacterium]|jgi:D-glycero-D-manno-heptose 1,7-bisphosphate phosphatase|nr:HAD-IIIA family hydrolase [Chloroflexota bacterium]